MQFIDLKQQYQLIKQEMDAAVARVLEHGQFIMGPEVAELESILAQYVGAQHAIVMSSGTTALQVALMALEIQPGDEIITTPFSFFATAEVIYLLGAKPIYVDINPHTYNLDAALLEQAITPRTKAIIPVSLYGQCADMDVINAVANHHGLAVIEDAAQSFGACYKDRKSCALSTIACTSFHPAKPLGAYGDAGASFTNDAQLAEKMRCILNHGQAGRYHHTMIGINGRCDTLQAAILIEKLKIFDDELVKRQQVAAWYNEFFAGRLVVPHIEAHNKSSWAQYTIQVKQRADVQRVLQEKNIPTVVHYPKGLHEQPIVAELEARVFVLPHANYAGQHVLSLPFHPYLTRNEVCDVVTGVLTTVSELACV